MLDVHVHSDRVRVHLMKSVLSVVGTEVAQSQIYSTTGGRERGTYFFLVRSNPVHVFAAKQPLAWYVIYSELRSETTRTISALEWWFLQLMVPFIHILYSA